MQDESNVALAATLHGSAAARASTETPSPASCKAVEVPVNFDPIPEKGAEEQHIAGDDLQQLLATSAAIPGLEGDVVPPLAASENFDSTEAISVDDAQQEDEQAEKERPEGERPEGEQPEGEQPEEDLNLLPKNAAADPSGPDTEAEVERHQATTAADLANSWRDLSDMDLPPSNDPFLPTAPLEHQGEQICTSLEISSNPTLLGHFGCRGLCICMPYLDWGSKLSG